MPLDIHHDGPVVRVTLDRPDVRNAFNEALIAELTAWAESAAPTAAERVAVLAGAGRMFCAGADVNWMSRMVGYSHEENVRDARAMVLLDFVGDRRLRIPREENSRPGLWRRLRRSRPCPLAQGRPSPLRPTSTIGAIRTSSGPDGSRRRAKGSPRRGSSRNARAARTNGRSAVRARLATARAVGGR